jgi:hypothetical protein
MPYRVGEYVKLTRRRGAPKDYCGEVRHVYRNGNYRVRILYDAQCNQVDPPITLLSVPPDILTDCDCH